MSGSELKNPSLALLGYYFISLYNNMGIVFWFTVIFIVLLIVRWLLYILQSKIERLSTNSKLLKYIHIVNNFSESIYTYLAVNQMISMTSLVLYLWYEYYEKSCFELKCFRSEVKLSSTKLVKFDVVVTIILISGQSIHFWRIII